MKRTNLHIAILAIIVVLGLVMTTAEASNAFLQIVWSAGWLFVSSKAAKRLESILPENNN